MQHRCFTNVYSVILRQCTRLEDFFELEKGDRYGDHRGKVWLGLVGLRGVVGIRLRKNVTISIQPQRAP
ncbi:hypothetical protein B0I21_104391 [Sphingobacterium paludis]|uniref:Uncharacterized protein n=1 Tax=Sphingobacterium paludis TaxID=1476465 RepID=A0A4R7D1E1_9SPHI|nr:hypothetical protein B0I21_104391 [Sphingobacterium paludis]